MHIHVVNSSNSSVMIDLTPRLRGMWEDSCQTWWKSTWETSSRKSVTLPTSQPTHTQNTSKITDQSCENSVENCSYVIIMIEWFIIKEIVHTSDYSWFQSLSLEHWSRPWKGENKTIRKVWQLYSFSLKLTVKPRYSEFLDTGKNYIFYQGSFYCQHTNNYENTSLNQNLYTLLAKLY